MKTMITILTLSILAVGYIDWNTKYIEELQYKTPKHLISDVIYEKPSFDIAKEDMEAQKAKYEAKQNELYNLIK